MPTQTEHYKLNQWEPGDNFLRTDFNEDNAKIDAAIAKKAEVVFGNYTGNDVYPRIIETGFQPSAVLLLTSNGYTNATGTEYGGLFGRGCPLKDTSTVYAEVTETGFKLTSQYTNAAKQVYYYIAFK